LKQQWLFAIFFVVVKPGLLQQGMEHLCLETRSWGFTSIWI